jgi:outer membrane biosynthesis protein TonB
MERAEKIGIGVAGAGHVLLFAAFSTHWLSADPLKIDTAPVEVTIADDVALRSAAPKISDAPPPSPATAPESIAEPEPAPLAPAMREAVPEPTPTPRPAPSLKPPPKPAPAQSQPAKPVTPATAAPARPKPGRGLRLDTSEWASASSGANPQAKPGDGAPASALGPAQQSALVAEIRRQIKPYWKAPTGADADLLRTTVSVKLARDGSLIGDPQIVGTTGQTASNRGQVRLHQEQALKAVRLAAPFRLPPDLYDGWKSLNINVDKRLSQ